MLSPDPDAVVIRFPPALAESLVKRLERDSRLPESGGRWRASVWADTPREGETEEDTIERIVQAAQLGGMKEARKSYVCSRAKELDGVVVALDKDGTEGEPDLHYSAEFQPNPDVGTVQRFLDAFHVHRRAGGPT